MKINTKIKSKYEVYYNQELITVDNLKEAEKKLRSSKNSSDFEFDYIVRKDYDEKGNLLEEWLIG